MSSEGICPKPRLSAHEAEALQTQVHQILESSAFRSSARCTEFLRHITNKVIEGQQDALHERAIAMDLFGKPSTYDPSEDSLVRTKASEVRRRLAQYYSEPDRQHELRLTLPSGSYALEWQWPVADEADFAPPPASKTRPAMWPVVALCFAIVVPVLFVGSRMLVGASPLERFWQPVLRSEKPVMLTLGNAAVYVLSPKLLAQSAEAHSGTPSAPPAASLDPASTLAARDLISQQGQYVGTGGAHAVLNYTAFFTRHRKRVFLRTGVEYSFSDLRNSPTVMLGAFSNQWTIRAARDLRFYFAQIEGQQFVIDRSDGKRWAVDPFTDPRNLTDYVIVARVFPAKSESGELVIIAAGVTQYGAVTASEFLTQPGHFERALKNAPPDWDQKNIEILLRSNVVAGTPAPPEVVATHFW